MILQHCGDFCLPHSHESAGVHVFHPDPPSPSYSSGHPVPALSTLPHVLNWTGKGYFLYRWAIIASQDSLSQPYENGLGRALPLQG